MRYRKLLSTATLVVSSLLLSQLAVAGKFNAVLDVGDPAPKWTGLQGVDGKQHSLKDFQSAKALVVVFTCNHCPIAQVHEERIKEFAKRYRDKGVELVAISVSLQKADNLEAMKTHAQEREFNFPYLIDLSQKTGREYGASVTPHVFVLDGDRNIAYMGAFDDDFTGRDVTEHYVQDAVDAILAGKQPEVTESKQTGCHIQYTPESPKPRRPAD